MELFRLQARTCWWTLYRRRPLLPHAQGSTISYQPEMILSGRRINDSMPTYVATIVIRNFLSMRSIYQIQNTCVGITFKEDCPDTRNTKVLDLISAIEAFGVLVDAYDPYLLSGDINVHKSVNLIQEMLPSNYDGILSLSDIMNLG